jgi:hypothetical protein
MTICDYHKHRLNWHCPFLGAIRGVRFWNRALTASEVQMVSTNVIPPDGLVAEYLLEQDVAPDHHSCSVLERRLLARGVSS